MRSIPLASITATHDKYGLAHIHINDVIVLMFNRENLWGIGDYKFSICAMNIHGDIFRNKIEDFRE